MIRKVDSRHLTEIKEILKNKKEAYDKKMEEGRKDELSQFIYLWKGNFNPDSQYEEIKIIEAIVKEIERNEFALLETSEQNVLGHLFKYYV